MFESGTLDVLGGGGNPDFDDNGKPAAEPGYHWIPKDIWENLKNGTEGQWTLVQSRGDIEALASGAKHLDTRLAMIPQVAATPQMQRDYAPGTEKLHAPPAADLQNPRPAK